VKLKPPYPVPADMATSLSSGLPLQAGQRTGPSVAIQASLLFQGSPEILIDHKGETYRLRITKNDKLILTK